MNASKHRAEVEQLASVFWIHLLDFCSTFARSCKRGITDRERTAFVQPAVKIWHSCSWLHFDMTSACDRWTDRQTDARAVGNSRAIY